MDEETVSKAEAATMMGVSERTVDRWFPPGHEARSMTRARPGQPAQVRLNKRMIKAALGQLDIRAGADDGQ